MINEISLAKILDSEISDSGTSNSVIQKSDNFVLLPFYFEGKPLAGKNFPRWGMTLLSAGTMRFRWNEKNEKRTKVFGEILKNQNPQNKKIVPIELIHSKIVVEAKNQDDTKGLRADGIITKNRELVPAVTVADCVPIFLYDTISGAFGVLHSGWKGTGIAEAGVKKMAELYGSKPEDICAAIGPHIQECCYSIDKERAKYFAENFGKSCIFKTSAPENELSYALSLTQANIFVLKNAGIREENIVSAKDCTCCAKYSDKKNIFGSFRRQAVSLPQENLKKLEKDELSRRMTVQAAFII